MKNSIVSRAIEVFREEGMKDFFRKTSAYLINKTDLINRANLFTLPYCTNKIKHLGCKLTLDELVDFAFNVCVGMIKPIQRRSEIVGLLKFVKMMKPKRILEIGTANGGTLFLFTRVSSEDATIVSIDLLRRKFGGGGEGYSKWRKSLYRSFAFSNQKIHLLQANSHKRATLRQTKAILGDEKCDFLFIDADHTYKGVKKDFEMYSPLTRKGSIIAFHDIVPSPKHVGAPQFWREIKRFYESEEIVENWGQRGGGIGLIKV